MDGQTAEWACNIKCGGTEVWAGSINCGREEDNVGRKYTVWERSRKWGREENVIGQQKVLVVAVCVHSSRKCKWAAEHLSRQEKKCEWEKKM